jgi:hypothetical protein
MNKTIEKTLYISMNIFGVLYVISYLATLATFEEYFFALFTICAMILITDCTLT